MLTVQPAQLNFNKDGIPCSEQFGDPYFSLANPLAESQYVFLDSSNIINRWMNKHFTIAELGFGFGINFITTANHWNTSSQPNHRLHYISIEKYPVLTDDLAQCYKQLNIASPVIDSLLQNYPPLVEGFHRIEFNDYNIVLTLIFGDADDYLEQCEFEADAWFLDGFSPSKNKALWSNDTAEHIQRLTKKGGTLSTYSAASEVRKSFSKVGFDITKLSGYGKKREMLVGTLKSKQSLSSFNLKDKPWFINKKNNAKNRNAIVIGAGMAGSAISAALAKRGWQITLVDKNDSLATEGSGNANAILMPRISVDHDTQSQLTLLGFLYSVRYFNHLQSHSEEFNWQQCGAIQLPRDEAQWKRMQQIISQEHIPDSLLQPISQQDANQLSNCEIAKQGWHIPLAGWLSPNNFCSALLNQHSKNINFLTNTEICNIERQQAQWVAYNKYKHELCRADIVIVANANSADQFSQTHWCQLHSKRGQITLLPQAASNIHPTKIVCADGYITPEVDAHYVVGATFITADTSTELRDSEHVENLKKLKNMIPNYAYDDINILDGRAGIRAVSPDRLPIIGPVANEVRFNSAYRDAALGSTHHKYLPPHYHDGLYLMSGFGSRGLAWIPLCSEALACTINNEPNPLNKNILQAIHPSRFLMKNLIKQVQSET